MADAVQLGNLAERPWGGALYASKDYRYLVDSNNGSYATNFLRFDTGSFCNAATWIVWSEAFIYMQMGLQIAIRTNQGGLVNSNKELTTQPIVAVGPKNSFIHFFDNITVQLNGASIIQTPGYLNVIQHWEFLMSTSQQMADLLGPSIGFCLDGHESTSMVPSVATANLADLRNNDVIPDIDTVYNASTTPVIIFSNVNVPQSQASTTTPVVLGTASATTLAGQVLAGRNYEAAAAGNFAQVCTYPQEFQVLPRALRSVSWNAGLLKRCRLINRLCASGPTNAAANAFSYIQTTGDDPAVSVALRRNRCYASPLALSNNANNADVQFPRQYVTQAPANSQDGNIAGNNCQYVWNITMPLKLLHPFWAQLEFPLRNSNWTIFAYLNLITGLGPNNGVQCAIPSANAANTDDAGGSCCPVGWSVSTPWGIMNDIFRSYNGGAPTLSWSRTNPIMITNLGGATYDRSTATASFPATGGTAVGAGTGLQSGTSLGSGICDVKTIIQSPTYLYFPVVDPRPEQITAIFKQEKWARLISFRDYLWFKHPTGCSRNQSFQWQPSQGVQNIRRMFLLLVPRVDINNSAQWMDPMQGYCTTEPGTTSPGLDITNFNVQLGMTTVYQNPVNYNYEFFLQQFKDNYMNGGQDFVFGSGLITQEMWEKNYKIFPINLTRASYTLPPNQPIAITISFQANLASYCDVHLFVQQERVVAMTQGDQTVAVVMG